MCLGHPIPLRSVFPSVHLVPLTFGVQLKNLLDAESSLCNSTDRNGKSLLHLAVEKNAEELVRSLLWPQLTFYMQNFVVRSRY
jgi:hypothetical protein